MHIVISLLYGFTIWFSLLAYAAITGVNLSGVFVAFPFVISGAVAFISILDICLCKLRKLWA